ncbi:MAG TPA: hypothetical protein VL201_03345 [Patescibacteria group bacterium]|jgi:hypothetical protein|nr:hypothetical protein [Patescibacteria group bacterium]
MYTSAACKKMILFLMYAYCANSMCSEKKSHSRAEYDSKIPKNMMIISFDGRKDMAAALDSPFGICLSRRCSRFFFREDNFLQFIASFRNPKKREYLTQNKADVFQYNTIGNLGSFLDHVQKEEYVITLLKPDSTKNDDEIKKVINALFMLTFLRQYNMFNNNLISEDKYSELLINFSNTLFHALLNQKDLSYQEEFYLQKMPN